MEQIAEEIISARAAAAGIYLTVRSVRLVVDLQIGSSTGASQAMAHGVKRAAVIVVCFVDGVTARDRGSQVATMMTAVNNKGDALAMGRARHAGGAASRRHGYADDRSEFFAAGAWARPLEETLSSFYSLAHLFVGKVASQCLA